VRELPANTDPSGWEFLISESIGGAIRARGTTSSVPDAQAFMPNWEALIELCAGVRRAWLLWTVFGVWAKLAARDAVESIKRWLRKTIPGFG